MKFQKNNTILRFEVLDSTSRYLRENLEVLESGTVVVAKNQNGGRGRLGKSWSSDDSMLMFSVLVKEVDYPQFIGFAASVSVVVALKKLFGIDAFIKWPNDIIAENCKVCGILCESRIVCACQDYPADINNLNHSNKSKPYVICGIGINVSTESDFFLKNNLAHAASLKMLYNADIDKEILLDRILSEFFQLAGVDFSEYKNYYTEKCLTLKREIVIIKGGEKICAKAVDINREGFLVCQDLTDKPETFTVNSGEVSIRSEDGYI